MNETTSRGLWWWRALCTGVLVAAVVLLAGGCSAKSAADDPGSGASSADNPASDPESPEDGNWIVYINDEQTQEQGGITYSIAMNLTAKNDTGNPVGPYTGEATAQTTTQGNVNGADLNASAIAKSTQLEFTLVEPDSSSTVESETGGALAPLTEQGDYTGTGSITMAAAGSGTVGAAGGSFGNTSGQSFTITVNGGVAVMKISINDMQWTFTGVMRSEPK